MKRSDFDKNGNYRNILVADEFYSIAELDGARIKRYGKKSVYTLKHNYIYWTADGKRGLVGIKLDEVEKIIKTAI